MKRFNGVFVLTMVLLILFSGVSMAHWSANVTATAEKHDELVFIYTTVVNYEAKDWLHFTGILDKHSIKGLDGDLSVTAYVPFARVIYATAGVRRGLHKSETPTIPYAQVTLQF